MATSDGAKLAWSDEASSRLRKVPFFIRPLVRNRAERAARERGMREVTAELLDELKGASHPRE